MLDVAEVLGHGQRAQSHAQSRARRLVHLAEHEGGLVEDPGLAHLDDQVVALTGALADAGEDGHAVVVEGHALDHLLDEDRLSDAGTAEQADLAALDVGGEQVDDLDPRLEHPRLGLELVEGRRLAVDRPALLDLKGLVAVEVEALAEHVEHVALGHVSDGDDDGGPRVGDDGAAHEPVGRLHGDAPDDVVSEVLGDLQRHLVGVLALALGGQVDVGRQCVVDLRQGVGRELDVDDGADDLDDASGSGGGYERGGHVSPSRRVYASCLSASAPETISVISVVISAWRALLAMRV